ncbi:5'-nucleotidase C-terminal domain-containing protein [Aureispira]|nr:5'-nucleotidase C-terminal domain-containing protein [Aureispira sp.]
MNLTREDSSVNAIIAPYKKDIGDEMNKVIGQVANMFTKQQPESTLGNWASDVTHSKCEQYLNQKLDFAVLNYGGLRIPSLPEGDVTKGKIFELMPFENYLVLVEMKGSDLSALFDHMAQEGGWPVSSHVKMTIHHNKTIDVRINNRKIENDKTYSFATIDYIANGGDNCDFLIEKKKVETGVLFRDAIIEFIEDETKAGRKLNAKLEHRVFILK